MFILGYFLLALAKIINIVLILFTLLIVIRAVMSWVRPNPCSRFVRLVYSLSEPVLYQVRRRVPVVFSGLDFSPVVVFLIIVFLREFLVRSLTALAYMTF